MHRSIRALRALAVACVLVGATSASASAATPRTALPGSQPSWATPAADAGAAPASEAKTFWVYLKLRNEGELDQRIDNTSDPSSAQYGQFLTPDQFRARYAPAAADVAAVRSWLASQGFAVSDDVPANNRWVKATGDVARVQRAFSTRVHRFNHRGKVLDAPTGALTVPTSIAGVVSGVAGIDGGDRLVRPQQATQSPEAQKRDLPGAPPSPAFVNAPPCSTFWAEKTATDTPPAYGSVRPYAPCGYTPNQLQGAYGIKGAVAAGLNGAGQTVAITDAFASPTIVQDANQYATTHGQPGVVDGQNFRQIVPPGIFDVPEDEPTGCDPQGWYGEETLDVEAVHAIAPAAHILYVGGQDCNDESLIAAINTVVDNNLANAVSNSWGGIGEDVPGAIEHAYRDTFRQAAAEGIGIYFSSGDAGDEIEDAGFRTVDFPANEPLVTAVGGTSLAVGAGDDYLFETGWGTKTTDLVDRAWTPEPPGDFLYGGGGGTSRVFGQPTYQKRVVPDDLARFFGGGRRRTVPDVAMVGDPNTGMLVGQTQTFPDGSERYSEYRLGGTSLSSPLFAAMMALADQAAGHRHGFANPALYDRAGSPAFRDIVSPRDQVAVVRNDFVNGVDDADGIVTHLRTMNQTGTLHTRPGYDDVTGVGTPFGPAFLQSLSGSR